MPFITTFLYSQLLTSLPVPTASFAGQTVIVTGSSGGLGLEAARHFVRLGAAKVIIAVRSAAKGATAVASILASEPNVAPSTVEVWALDLASTASIEAFAKRAGGLERLDAVVANAGILTNEWSLVEGTESVLAIDVVQTMLMGLLLLPKLRESAARWGARGRLSFVGSDMMFLAKLKEKNDLGDRSLLERMNTKEESDMDDRYANAKLLLMYAVRRLAAMSPVSPASNVVINILTPGACRSDIFRDDAPLLTKLAMGVAMAVVARTTEQGSRTLVHAALPDIGVETHGQFLMDCKIYEAGDNVDSEWALALQEKFGNELFAKLESLKPGVTKI